MLKYKARSAILWAGLEAILRTGISFLISVVLARLLVPEEFGTIALLGLFIGVANLFISAGLGQALVQRQDVTHTDQSTVFWFNLGVAFLMACLLVASAPFIAGFFGIPVLLPLMIALALNVAVGSLGSIHFALLTKSLDFKSLTKIGVLSAVLSGGIAITLAWAGFGVWALAGQTISATLVTVTSLWWLSTWRPLWTFSTSSFHKLFGFGGWLFASGFLDVVYQRGYTILIGKFYSTRDLGLYGRADNIQTLASELMSNVLAKVAFPLLSAVNGDKTRLRNGVRLSIQTAMLLTAPIMVGLATLAEPLILVIYGQKWMSVVPILQVLCVTGLLLPFHLINLNVLQAQGYSHLFFRLELAKKTVGIILILCGSLYGLIGMAFGRALGGVAALLINAFYTKKILDYGSAEQLKDSSMSLFLASIMGGAILVIEDSAVVDDVFGILLLIVFGFSLYLMLNIIFNSVAFKQLLRLLAKNDHG